MNVFEMKIHLLLPLAVICCLLGIGSQVAQAQTAYTSDTNVAHFTAGITSYATLSNFNNSDNCVDGSSFTPTSSELAAAPCRVYNLPPSTPVAGLSSENNWILAAFSSPVSTIVVFPNMDHLGSAYDGYQYQIYGSNDYGSSEVPTWTKLFDALTVNGDGEPFTLGSSTGTPPSTVNNVVTGGCTPTGSGCVGYEAQFSFGTAYKYYAFGASTVAAGNTEQEFSAVGTSSQTQTLGGPGTTATFTFNTDSYKITGQTNQGGEQLTITAFLVPANSFPTGEGGLNGFSNETCVPYGDDSASLGHDTCVEFQTHCQLSATDATPCNFIYLLATGYDLPADLSGGIGGPDFLVAHGQPCPLTSTSTVQSIFLSYEATIKDPTTRGGSKGPSCFVATYTPGALPITTGTTSAFDGWEPPVSNTALNQVKAGAVRRLKFQLFNNLGIPVTHLSLCNSFTFAPGTGNVCNDPTVLKPWVNLSSFGIACPDGTPRSNTTDETALSSADNSGLLNRGGGNYVFRWKTEKNWKGLCANVTATFDSGLTVVPATKGFHFNSAGDDQEE